MIRAPLATALVMAAFAATAPGGFAAAAAAAAWSPAPQDASSPASRSGAAPAPSRPAPPRSVHQAQLEELGAELDAVTEDGREAARLEREHRLFPAGARKAARSATPLIDPRFVVFGYLQSESQVFHTRWHALTHVGSRFVSFDAAGHLTGTSAFTGRSSYLKAGGAAEAAGVKVILVVNNFDDSPGGTIQTVMTNPSLRAVLAGEIVQLLAADSYSHGASLDLEFSWGAVVRDGITAFMSELRQAMDAVNPSWELSIYTNAIFSASQWDFDAQSGITPSIDYMIYSMYDWATGLQAHAITDFNNCLGATRIQGYLNDGLPPEKLVLAISAYSRQWANTGIYNGTGTNSSSSGFTDALYDVTLNPNTGGPFPEQYVRGDECGWYAWNDGISHTRTWEAREGAGYEIRHALSLQDPAGIWNGRRIRGIAFWSLYWMAETSSWDPRTQSLVSRTRTYPHLYQTCQEVLAPPGTTRFLIEGFEGLDFRWRDPNESPDTTGDADGDSKRAIVAAPPGPGAPASTTNAMELTIDVEGGGTNQVVLAHEVLASPLAPSITDTNATAAHFAAATMLSAFLHVPAALPGWTLRMLLADRDGELEASDPSPLAATGWREITWDLTDPSTVHGHPTLEPAFASGDGVLDTAGGGARDLSFYGFLAEGPGPMAATIVLDEVAYEPRNPAGAAYTINEFRTADPAREFVEIHGPAGPLPAGLELRVYDASDGGVRRSFPLAGSIPDDGGGFGFYVAGDPGVPNTDSTAGFSATGDDLSDADPSALQLLAPATGCVYDSVVTGAFGGLDDLIRDETQDVTGEGWPWLGEIATGTDGTGEPYTMGRLPDGRDTQVNARDFSFQPATPGASNARKLPPSVTLDFETPPPGAFQTFQTFAVSDPSAAGLPPSPAGGLAYHGVDGNGGGVIGVIGDASWGLPGGLRVQGWLYVPADTAPPQAVAVGLAGSQGSRFFPTTLVDRSAYENGYWLVYENRPGVGLADGRPDHPGVLEFVQASHDHMDGNPVDLLGSLPLASTGAVPGAWTTFTIEIDRQAPPATQLRVRVAGTWVYRGPLPPGGPVAGAFQVGFRENHTGPPGPDEGTWIDGLTVRAAAQAALADPAPPLR